MRPSSSFFTPAPADARPRPISTGRETFLTTVTWDDAGWPVFNNNQSIAPTSPGLYNVSDPLASTSFFDDFTSNTLDLGYYFLRTPQIAFHNLLEGSLRLQGTPFALGDRETPSLLLRKQTAFNQRFETVLDFVPDSSKEEAGLTVFYSDFYHQDIAVTQCPATSSSSFNSSAVEPRTFGNSTRCIVNRLTYGNNGTGLVVANATQTFSTFFPISDGPVKLAIQSENTRYSFGYSQGSADNLTWVGAIDSIWLYSAPPGCVLLICLALGLGADSSLIFQIRSLQGHSLRRLRAGWRSKHVRQSS